ncbi:MAG: penicillin-binding protein 2 [Anaerolineae bacterium]
MLLGSKRLVVVAISVVLLATSCQGGAPFSGRDATPTPTPLQAEDTARAFLESWERSDYGAMYALLSPSAQATIRPQEFARLYRDVAAEAAITSISTDVRSALQDGAEAQVAYHVIMESAPVGPIEVENVMPLSWTSAQEQTGGRWGVDWSAGLIFKELEGGNLLRMSEQIPTRGNIFDRHGQGLAITKPAVTVGVVPGEIEDEDRLLAELSPILALDPAAIKAKYANAAPHWFVPLKEISLELRQAYRDVLSELQGLRLRETVVRSYPEGGIAPHAVGYMGAIGPDELDHWKAQGYRGDELVGKSGLERWGEDYLAGRQGATLTVVTPAGNPVAILKERTYVPSRDIYTTLDSKLQKAAEAALAGRVGAIVALNLHSGQILAMVSWPTFDPNAFVSGLSPEEWQALANDPGRPLVNRAVQGAYPPGSVFKIVTMATALEAGGFTPRSTFTCTGLWEGLGPDWPKTCWVETGHGQIDLVQALIVSCDVAFYDIGLALHHLDSELLPDYARQFGLGSPTGLEGLDEATGLVPDDAWKITAMGEGLTPGDSVNSAIGQGYLLTTPLQIANVLAAVANGGTIYQPQILLKVAASSEEPEESFAPQVMGQLPISSDHLAAIQEGLVGVTASPYGTAHEAFQGLEVSVAGKTGTAETGTGEPHAWFAGYAPADGPQIAVAVIVEYGGDGAEVAAPIFRQVIEAFFGI